MRTIPSALQAKLDSGVTTLCRCWIVTRSDGVVQGFTDHDEDVARRRRHLPRRHRADRQRGDAEARPRDRRVRRSPARWPTTRSTRTISPPAATTRPASNSGWSTGASRTCACCSPRASLGEVKRDGPAFTAELRGLERAADAGHRPALTPRPARPISATRAARSISTLPAYHGSGMVAGADGDLVVHRQRARCFRRRLVHRRQTDLHRRRQCRPARRGEDASQQWRGHASTLWQAMPQPIAAGDAFTVTAGCDKPFATCHDRFDNVVNFRGFPHIPATTSSSAIRCRASRAMTARV